MPVKIPDNLPARSILEEEHIFVMTETRALHQDIRPLEIAIVNLMPTKIVTETQLLRLLSNSALQINVTFVRAANHVSKNTASDHLEKFYTTFDKIKNRAFDGMIITGAPIEKIPFEDVDYWQELTEIMKYSKKCVHSTIFICWGAQAGLYYFYGIPKYDLPSKISGVYEHRIVKKSKLFHGFDDVFYVPHSRYTEVRRNDIEKVNTLDILAESDDVGVFAIATQNCRQIFITGHMEYDPDTLGNEYIRDVDKGIDPLIPRNYYPEDNPANPPNVKWRAHANLFYSNWLNYCVYQETPYLLEEISEK